ncbi:hypothetical protein CALVIDRAFT_526523 [Calocera viscosa TUFC12733]|uniref:Uncharacterized protein n=1 Tax=Calocera viscosa (strain TUFC12733) TaxID=1330018 RepID=A0A167NJA4_CALVF|nr:hypothetical protein CALVIDRAFT_526523 [Calocera viscosa TUFC12733]
MGDKKLAIRRMPNEKRRAHYEVELRESRAKSKSAGEPAPSKPKPQPAPRPLRKTSHVIEPSLRETRSSAKSGAIILPEMPQVDIPFHAPDNDRNDNAPCPTGWTPPLDIGSGWTETDADFEPSNDVGNNTLDLPESELAARFAVAYRQGLIPRGNRRASEVSQSDRTQERPLDSGHGEKHVEEEDYNLTGALSAYEEQTDREAEEEEADHILPYKIVDGTIARTLHLAMSTGLRGLLYQVSKLLKCHPDALSIAYLLSTSKAKEHPVLLDSPGTFLEMVRVWKAATTREQDKFEIAWNRREATQDSSPPRKKAKKGKKSRRAVSPDNIPNKKERSDAEMLLQLKAARQCHQHGKPDFVLPGGVHIDPSDEDWSFWALALTKKVDNVTHDNPPDTILNKWTTVYNVRAPGAIIRSATSPQKGADIAHAAAQNVLQGLMPWVPPFWNPSSLSTTGSALTPPVMVQQIQRPPALTTVPGSQINVQDLIDDSTIYPRIDAWLVEVDANPKRNPDDRNFSQYAAGLDSAGLYRINELAAIEAAEMVEIYNSAEPTPIPSRLTPGAASVLIGYARKNIYGK